MPMKTILILVVLLIVVSVARSRESGAPPVRIAIYGLVHDHARGMIPRFEGRSDVQLALASERVCQPASESRARRGSDPGSVAPADKTPPRS